MSPDKIIVQFPSEFIVSAGASVSIINGIAGSSFTNTGNQITISSSGGFSPTPKFSFSISGIANPNLQTSNKIIIETRDSLGYLIDTSSNLDLKFALKCTTPCKDCALSTPSVCTQCYGINGLPGVGDNIIFGSNQCKSTCSNGEYLSGSCLPCDVKCSLCSVSATNCQECKTGFFLSGSTCVATCPTGQYGDSVLKICVNCDPSCSACTGTSVNCTSCSSTYYLYNSKCVGNCPADVTIADTIAKVCNPCTSGCLICQTIPAQCVTCTAGLYYTN